MATIERKPINTEGLEELTQKGVHRMIRKVLGYEPISNAVALKKLADAFVDLGIEPFDRKQIDEYKHTKAVTTPYRVSWSRTELGMYSKNIPGFALIRAAQVGKFMDREGIKGTFWVEELVRDDRKVLDPFMILLAAGMEFYLDVWEEPGFEGRRTQ